MDLKTIIFLIFFVRMEAKGNLGFCSFDTVYFFSPPTLSLVCLEYAKKARLHLFPPPSAGIIKTTHTSRLFCF